MCASALPGENATHEIGVDMIEIRVKKSPKVIDCNWNEDDQI